MTTRILCVGDLHLGKRPGRSPAGIDPAELGPAAAWKRCVEIALAQKVDAVLMAGDVVERIEDRFAAFESLRAGVQRLTEAGIRVLGVTGNHDVEALPRLAQLLPDYGLLGRGGLWEEVSLGTADPVSVVGWSFPARHHSDSPLADLPPRTGRGLRLGLLHCDVDQPHSAYAPVTSAELASADADAWLLGHIHTPGALDERTPRGYLGSVVGLDPTETGRHGPWMISVERGALQFEHLPLAPLRWERVVVDVEGGDLLGALDRAASQVERMLAKEGANPLAVGVRVVVGGSPADPDEFERDLRRLREEPFERNGDGFVVFVDKVIDATQPELDVLNRSRRGDHPGLVAKRLVALEEGGDEARDVLRTARKAIGDDIARLAQRLGRENLGIDDETLTRALERAGVEVMAKLVSQVDERPKGAGATATVEATAAEGDDR
ncbi:putative metallophosphoesterase YhaO [Planctomycetes bacterium Pla163]|uniref:Putative metallophosphoesterase YhaO n=1 Tax=Rohdeia mirabilis TaxID=2528008 RepID=A0A518CW36_9BACT|nr:putative metallophosphoesterase YhaO [Planctomycetes bacterium Pla163]